MGRRTEKNHHPKSHTLPSSPTHSFCSSSSSDFEFTISLSPRKSSTHLCPADELFYKGQILPLHLSPRISMVRTLLLASSSISSSSDTTTTASRDSTGSSDSNSSFSSDLADCDSSARHSSVAEDDELKHLNTHFNHQIKKTKYFSFSRLSSVFRKEPKSGDSSVKRMSSTAKEVIRKYLKKAKPLYEKLSQKQKMESPATATVRTLKTEESMKGNSGSLLDSFSGNLRYPKKRSYVSSCPSSMRSSPSHSGILYGNGVSGPGAGGGSSYADASSMEELQSAVQGAIAHCKNSLIQKKSMISNEI